MKAIPPQLLSFEQQLRALQPTPARTTPEQMLYQAGWEAALAHVASTTPPLTLVAPAQPTVRVNRRSAAWYWPVSTAALLLLSATLGWRVWEQPAAAIPAISGPAAPAPQLAQTPPRPIEPPATATVLTSPSASVPLAMSNTVSYSTAYSPRQETRDETDYQKLASYLELRDRIARGGLSMLPTPAYRGDEQRRAPKSTQRELLADLWREVL